MGEVYFYILVTSPVDGGKCPATLPLRVSAPGMGPIASLNMVAKRKLFALDRIKVV
jgi:hypothetical protein